MADVAENDDLRMLRIEQVLDLFPVSRVTLYRMIRAGEFPEPMKMGRTSLWRRSHLHRFVEERDILPDAPAAIAVTSSKIRRGADLI